MTSCVSFWKSLRLAMIAVALAGYAMPLVHAETAEPPLAYRRILVPADRPATWPREGQTLLPVEARDFDAWVAASNQAPSTAAIADARYEARLENNELVDCRGRWQVQLHGGHAARLRVGAMSISIEEPRWLEATDPADKAARWGWWPGDDGPRFENALEVPRTGELEFGWSVTSTAATRRDGEVRLQFPIAARTELVLDVPPGKRPVAENCVLLKSPQPPDAGGRWEFALKPGASTLLRFEGTPSRSTADVPSATVQSEHRYHVSTRGLELRATLRLSASDAAAEELDVGLPDGMQLVEALADGKSLKWRVVPREKGDPADQTDERPRVAIEMPPTGPAQKRVVTLRAWGPLTLGEPLRLPLLAVDDTSWTSGTVELELEDSLELDKLAPIDCLQTAVELPANVADAARSYRFDAFSPSAAVEIQIADRRPQGSVHVGTSLELGNAGAAARLVADVTVDRGSMHRVSADVESGWSIDSVETVPAGALGEWYVEPADGTRRLELQLTRAIAPGQNVRVVVNASRARANALDPLAATKMNLLEWRDLQVQHNLLQIRPGEQFELEPVGDLPWIATTTLSSRERLLFASLTSGPICDLAAFDANAAVRLAPKKGAYEAVVQLDVDFAHDQLKQRFLIECRPEGRGIDHVLIYLSQQPTEPLVWTLGDTHEPLIAERMPASDPRLRGLPPGGELWLLHLRRMYAQPIAISATSSTPLRERQEVLLVSAPDAAAQQGRVAIATTGDQIPSIEAQGMTPTPLPIGPTSDQSADFSREVCAVYRFQPTRLYDAGPTPQLKLGPPTTGSESAQQLATRVDVVSRYTADGQGAHQITCQLERHAAGPVVFALPTNVTLESARVDGQWVSGTHAGTIDIPQALHRPSSVVELTLSSYGEPLANGSRLAFPLPLSELTVLDGHWKIAVPQGFAASSYNSWSQSHAAGWSERLFGALARPHDQAAFNPFLGGHWNKLWAELSGASSTPAQAAEAATVESRPEYAGWESFDVDFLSTPPASAALIHRPLSAALALAVFLACAVGASLCGARRSTLALAALVTAAAGLALPAIVAPLAGGAMLGLVIAMLVRWWQRMFEPHRATAALLAIVAAFATTPASAAPPTAPVERVLVPIDAKGEPVGSKYFVGDEFLRKLLLESEQRSTTGKWLLTKMSLEGELVSRPDQAAVRCGAWRIVLDVETFTQDSKISLPLVRSEADWPEAATIDGMPTPIEWQSGGEGCNIPIAEPGRHRLSIAFEPRSASRDGRQQLKLTLPPVPGAALSIALPANLADLRTMGTRAERRDPANLPIWRGELDGSGSFGASWPTELSDSGLVARHSVDELQWLQLGPEGRTLDVRYLLPSGAFWPETIEIAADPDWELIGEEIDSATGDPKSQDGGRELIRICTHPEERHSPTRTLRFRARDTSALGHTRLPNIGLTSFPIENRWLAVSCDPSLDCVPSSPAQTTAAPPADLTNGLSPPNAVPPQILANAARLDANWFLHVRPRVELSKHRDELALLAGRARCRIEYTSDVVPKMSDHFGWSLAVPEDLTVESITAKSGGQLIPADWVRSTANRVTIFFGRALAGPYQIRLVGSMPVSGSLPVSGSIPVSEEGRCALPTLSPAGQPPAISRVALYREEEVLASWQLPAATHWSDADASDTPPFGPDAIFVKAYSIDEPSTGDAVVRIEANDPVVSGDTLTTVFRETVTRENVARENGVWNAAWTCDLHVERGALDVVRLKLPPQCRGPFEVFPAMNTKFDAASDPARAATLSIHLPQSVGRGDVLKLLVRSPLTLTEGELPTAPEITLVAGGERRNFLALPVRLDGDSADWTRRGIEPAKLPPGLRPNSPHPREHATFQMADAIDVSLRPRAPESASANVELAETAIHVDAAGSMVTVTRFVLTSAGLDHCDVELPAGDRMVRMTLDGHPAVARALDAGRWQVQLGAPSLPQKLDIITQARAAGANSADSIEASRPQLKHADQPIPIDLSLWTIYHAGQQGTPHVSGGALVTARELATARLDRLVSVSQNATRSVVEAPVVDGTGWFARWAEDLRAAEKLAGLQERSAVAATEAIRVPQSADSDASETVARLHAWLDQITDAFSMTEFAESESTATQRVAYDPWRTAQEAAAGQTCFMSDGDQSRAQVEWEADGISFAAARALFLASCAVLACALVWLKRTPTARELVERWPEVAWLLLGVAAWMWLRPSVVGFLAAAISAAFLLRRIAREIKITKARPPQTTELDSGASGETQKSAQR